MQKLLVRALAILFFASPAFAFADSIVPLQPTVGQLLSRVAALNAILNHKDVSCAVTTSTLQARVGEQYTVSWGSYGSDFGVTTESRWTPSGTQTVVANAPGIYDYKFVFYSATASSTCDLAVSVS